MEKINFSNLSSSELDDFVLNNLNDAAAMLAYSEFLRSKEASAKDAGFASSVNPEVQCAQGDKPTKEDKFQKVKVTNLNHDGESTSQDETSAKTEKVVSVRKIKTFKPKEVVAIDRKFHTIQEVAACYRIGVSTLHKYLKNGLIEGFKMGNQWRFSQDQISAFEKQIISLQTNIKQ